jgi:hypothetical protein
MVHDQGLGPAPAQVRAVQVVSTQLLEGVELANMVGLVMLEGLGLVQGLVHIIKDRILVMENLPMLVVLVVEEEEDKLEVTGDLVHRGLVVALDLALATLTGIGMGTDLVMQVQMLMAMVVALGAVKTVGEVAVKVLGLGTATPTPDFCIKTI